MSIPVPNEREATQQDDGSYRCNRCRGDWYACCCPRENSKPRGSFSITIPLGNVGPKWEPPIFPPLILERRNMFTFNLARIIADVIFLLMIMVESSPRPSLVGSSTQMQPKKWFLVDPPFG